MSELTPSQSNQLNIDLAFHQGRVKALVNAQQRDYMYAFGVIDAPNNHVQERCLADYWNSEKAIQDSLSRIHQIKVQLK